MSIAYNLYEAFDAYPTFETSGVLPGVFKAFEKVWHKGLTFKLKSIGVSDSLLGLIESSLIFHQVLPNGQRSEWLPVKVGGPQGCILRPHFFSLFILMTYQTIYYQQ